MALFIYQATDSARRLIKGSMEAKDERALVDRLQEMGYFPIGISKSDENEVTSTTEKRAAFNKFFTKRISRRVLINFTQELHNLTEAGVPLDKTVSILIELEENKVFKGVLLDIYNSIRGGSTLADSLSKYPTIFSNIYISMIRAGEASGALESILVRLKNYMEDIQRLEEDIISALIYPALLTIVGGSAVGLMVFFIIPKFSLIFSDMGGSLPLPTQLLLKMNDIIVRFLWVVLIPVAVFAFSLRYRLRTKEGRAYVDSLKLIIPLFGNIFKKVAVSRFSRTLGILLQGGLPIMDALRVAKDTIGNEAMAVKLDNVFDGVRRGKGIALPLKESQVFPLQAIYMLTIGEETGKLDEMFLKLADNYDREINVFIKRSLTLIEPAIILVMALVVGFVVIALLLAVLSINEIPI